MGKQVFWSARLQFLLQEEYKALNSISTLSLLKCRGERSASPHLLGVSSICLYPYLLMWLPHQHVQGQAVPSRHMYTSHIYTRSTWEHCERGGGWGGWRGGLNSCIACLDQEGWLSFTISPPHTQNKTLQEIPPRS